MDRHDLELAIIEWAKKYDTCIEVELQKGWANLELRLHRLADEMTWSELTLGPGPQFKKERLERETHGWNQTFVAPIVEDAEKELRKIYDNIEAFLHPQTGPVGAGEGGMLNRGDLLGPGAFGLGVWVGVGGVVAAISKVTTWIIFTTIVVNWWLVVAAVAIGLALAALGVASMGALKDTLRQRFRDNLVPVIKNAILGDKYVVDGKEMPSLRRQLKEMIEQGKIEALSKLEKGGAE